MPGIASPWLGAPPVAIRITFALIASPVPSRSVWASSNTARGLTMGAPDFSHVRRIGRLQPRDLLILVGDQGRPVEGCRRNGPAEACRIFDLVMHMGRIDQKLFRNAAANHAGAAHPVFFGNHDPRTVPGGDP